jgi:hypothetical protein
VFVKFLSSHLEQTAEFQQRSKAIARRFKYFLLEIEVAS